MDRWRAAVILTHNRPTDLMATVIALGGSPPSQGPDGFRRPAPAQVDQIIIVANASPDGAIPTHFGIACDLTVVPVPDQPPNLAALMNRGILAAVDHLPSDMDDNWDVAMLCDDAPPPPGWFDACAAGLDQTGAVIACTSSHHPAPRLIFKDQPDHDVYNRMCGWAFVIRNGQLRADENMHWWWQDTDLDWQARKAGGMVICPGPVVPNLHPNDYTNTRPDLADRIHFDGLAFDAKWGSRPW